MPRRSPFLRAAALLAALCIDPFGATAQEMTHFEVDWIFPRNETYTTSDTFPIALAIQNLPAVRSLGRFNVSWGIMPYRYGRIPGGIYYDESQFTIEGLDEAEETLIIVANTNVSDWIHQKDRGDTYAITWYLTWPELEQRCAPFKTTAYGRQYFTIEAPWENDRLYDTGWDAAGLGVPPDIMDVPECPEIYSVVELRPNSTFPACPIVVSEDTGREGNPCAVKVDGDVASSIASRASSLATPPPTSTPDSELDEPENAAGAANPPARIALAAVGALGCLAFVS